MYKLCMSKQNPHIRKHKRVYHFKNKAQSINKFQHVYDNPWTYFSGIFAPAANKRTTTGCWGDLNDIL